jgi:hypothetical protein
MDAAKSAGISTRDVYMFPCPTCGTASSQMSQLKSAVNGCSSYNGKVRELCKDYVVCALGSPHLLLSYPTTILALHIIVILIIISKSFNLKSTTIN